MDRDSLLALYGYNAYANKILLDTAAQLTEAELQSPSPSRESVYNLLRHMLSVEEHFLRRCQGRTLEQFQYPTLDALSEHWQQVDQEANGFIGGLDDAALAREIVPFIKFETFHLPMWQLLFQGYAHSTTHRGELSAVLTQLGHPLPIHDIIIYFAHQSGQAWPWDAA